MVFEISKVGGGKYRVIIRGYRGKEFGSLAAMYKSVYEARRAIRDLCVAAHNPVITERNAE